jgi:predicted alpha/beta superfamily hydrolase
MAHPVRNSLFITGFLISLALSACQPQTPTASFPRVSIPCSEIRQLKSTATGRDYDLYIRLPNDYKEYPKVKYPVLYLLDAQWDFKMLDSIYGGLEYDDFVPEMIIVGITYTGEDADYNALRAMDLSPIPDSSIEGTGDAPRFFAFLKDQLMPFIESNYQTDPSRRILMGSSFGGLFTLYAMFTEPALFSGYVVSSPYVVYGNRYAFLQESDFAKSHTDLPVKLFISVGETEGLKQPVQMFIDELSGRDYKSLEMETRILEGEGHSSNKPESYNRGLRFVFQE